MPEHSEFLERADELAILRDELAAIGPRGGGRLLLVLGEAGVGKTALLRRFCADVDARVLAGACEPLLTQRPLAPLLEIGERAGGDLGILAASDARPHEVVAALLTTLERGPTVVVLEDLHWADEATLDVLRLLARRIDAAPALVLVSLRHDELDRLDPVRVTVGELPGPPRRMTLPPFSLAAVAELAEPLGLDARELHERTRGNPFFVTEVLAAGGGIPETVRDAVLARAARLSPQARAVLDAVAVSPGTVEVTLLEELAGGELDGLEECLSSGMLTVDGARVSFRHELARLAVESSCPPDRIVALHRRALAALGAGDEGDADAALIAHHAAAAGDRDALRIWGVRAGERASAAGAHREAADQYARVLDTPGELCSRERAQLLAALAEERYMTAHLDGAVTAQVEAVACLRELGDDRTLGDGLRRLSRLLFFAGRTAEGEQAALQAIGLLEPLGPSRELAIAYCNAAQRYTVTEDLVRADRWARRADEMVELTGDPEARMYALVNAGVIRSQTSLPEGHALLEEALARAQSGGFEEQAGRVFNHLAMWPLRARRPDLAEPSISAGLDYCGERGLDTWRLYLLALQAQLALGRGRWEEAGELAHEVLLDPHSALLARSWALTALGLLRARRGDPGAEQPLLEAHAIAAPTGEPARLAPVAAARAELAWLGGSGDDIDGLTAPALAIVVERSSAWAASELAYWRWRTGVPPGVPQELLTEPYRRSIEGDWKRAAAWWEQRGYPYEMALSLADSSEEGPLREAHERLLALGATPAVAIVAQRLRKRGVRGVRRGPNRATRENPAGLTARELEVLALLTEGLRNADIATRLVVSQKTVDHHVSAILRKLDVRTRGEAGAAAVRLGLTDRPA